MPIKITREIINFNVHAGIKAQPARFDALEAAGFRLDRYGDVYSNIFVRFGGHYIDSGASARIAKGEIKVKSIPVKGLGHDGVVFDNGDVVPADLVVLATGYEHDFRATASKLVGKEIADQMDDYFGLDGEGEIRGYAKKAGCKLRPHPFDLFLKHHANALTVPHLYYHGGDTRAARWYSRFIALQIQADCLTENST